MPNVVRRNALFTIFPYKKQGVWMFDDATIGVKEEAFVCGADDIIEKLVGAAGLLRPQRGFKLTFSNRQFPSSMLTLTRARAETGGTWYRAEGLGIEGWLCPVLNDYYPKSPKHLFVAVAAKE